MSSSVSESPRLIAIGIHCSIFWVIGVANEVTREQVLAVAWFGCGAADPCVISVVLVGFGRVALGAVGMLTGRKAYLSMVENSL